MLNLIILFYYCQEKQKGTEYFHPYDMYYVSGFSFFRHIGRAHAVGESLVHFMPSHPQFYRTVYLHHKLYGRKLCNAYPEELPHRLKIVLTNRVCYIIILSFGMQRYSRGYMKKYLNNGFNLILILYAFASPVSTSALYIFSGMMVIFGIGLLMGKKEGVEINKSIITLYIAFFAWGGFTAAFSGNYLFRDAFNHLWDYLPIVLLPIFFQVSNVKKEKVIVTLLISSSVICLLGIIQYLFPAIVYPFPKQLSEIVSGSRVFFGFFHNQNPAASFFSLITIIAFSLLFFWDIGKKTKIALLIFSGLTLTAVILTLSRNAFISVFMIFMIILFFKNRRWFVYGITIFIVSLIIILSFSNPVSNRLKTLTDNKYQNNSRRIEMWKIAVELFKEHPIVGIGKRNWEKVLTERKNNPQKWTFPSSIDVLGHPHNIYLQLLAETGIIGLFLFLAFWGNIVRLLIGRNSQMTKGSFESAFIKGVLGGLGNLFISNMFDSFLNALWILLLLSFLVGIALGESKQQIKEAK